VKPLEAAQQRLGKPGRPRKSAPDGEASARTAEPPAARSSAPAVPALCPRLVGVDDAAAYLNVSPWTVRDLHASGRLARVRLPLAGDRELRRLLFDVRDLDGLVDRSKESMP
jgi:hypothetical protein